MDEFEKLQKEFDDISKDYSDLSERRTKIISLLKDINDVIDKEGKVDNRFDALVNRIREEHNTLISIGDSLKERADNWKGKSNK